jgi:predicted Zn-dependent protease with MMP-like domain
MKRREFERLVDEVIAGIPAYFRRELQNLTFVVERSPPVELLAEMKVEPPDSLYGLYQGTPLSERDWSHGNNVPDQITLFQDPIETNGSSLSEIRKTVTETVIHEMGHYFGLSEYEIEEIENSYWRCKELSDDEDTT